MKKELCVTTDFMDDLLQAGRHYTPEDLDALMAYCASLGATRHEWILDTIWSLYDDDSPCGYDLLAEACAAAHRHGMRFDAIFKPWEGALAHEKVLLPPTFPKPDGVPLLEEPVGLVPATRPFVAAHPEMRLARRPDEARDPGGRIATIKLIQRGPAALTFSEADLSIWTGTVNGNGALSRYDGPVEFSETLEWRERFPATDEPCRIVSLGGLRLPGETRFIIVRCAKKNERGSFTNDLHRMVELENENGEALPAAVSSGRSNGEALHTRMQNDLRLGLSRYARHPETKSWLEDKDRFLAHCRDMHRYGIGMTELTLEKSGEIAVMRGKLPHVLGQLNPVYPEVRQHWLEHVKYCLDRGVDGVNIRVANHNRPTDPWAFGFNQPVLEQMEHPEVSAEAERINGDAYTLFLREAAELVHRHKKDLGVHVHGLMFQRHDGHGGPWGPMPCNIEWQWQTWIREIADYVEFRGANMLRPESLHPIIDRIGLAAREAGIPFNYQSSRSPAVVHFDGVCSTLEHEMEWVRRHPDIAIYNLYEAANFTKMDEQDRLIGSPGLARSVRRRWWD